MGKNTASSIKQRLLNFSREEGLEFQLILTHFALERFLYRISISSYKNEFILKGAMLFQVWGGLLQRPTRDLDLLGFGEPEVDHFKEIIKDLCKLNLTDDGVIYHADSIELERIKAEDEYKGLRASLLATLDSARIPLQIDIGFGDSLFPVSQDIDYPTLLDLPTPILRAYSKETVIAEKFHAMVHLGVANSRMKDFYDIWILLTKYSFEASVLTEAIRSTFKRRNTPVPNKIPLALTKEFSEVPNKVTQWNGFLRKGKLLHGQGITLDSVIGSISMFIVPLITGLMENSKKVYIWKPEVLLWDEKEY